jgi:hypothetical protein
MIRGAIRRSLKKHRVSKEVHDTGFRRRPPLVSALIPPSGQGREMRLFGKARWPRKWQRASKGRLTLKS